MLIRLRYCTTLMLLKRKVWNFLTTCEGHIYVLKRNKLILGNILVIYCVFDNFYCRQMHMCLKNIYSDNVR